VTNYNGASLSLWKAADLTDLGSCPFSFEGTYRPLAIRSDGIGFWATGSNGSGALLQRFLKTFTPASLVLDRVHI
jgi:hypothetical protein